MRTAAVLHLSAINFATSLTQQSLHLILSLVVIISLASTDGSASLVPVLLEGIRRFRVFEFDAQRRQFWLLIRIIRCDVGPCLVARRVHRQLEVSRQIMVETDLACFVDSQQHTYLASVVVLEKLALSCSALLPHLLTLHVLAPPIQLGATRVDHLLILFASADLHLCKLHKRLEVGSAALVLEGLSGGSLSISTNILYFLSRHSSYSPFSGPH